MSWLGSFKSLQTVLGKHRFTSAPLDVHTWVRSEIALISPLVDWLMNLIATSHCVCGEEQLVELALQEALRNAMLHGNRLEAGKLADLLIVDGDPLMDLTALGNVAAVFLAGVEVSNAKSA